MKLRGDALLDMLFGEVRDCVEFLFEDSIGCDGIHSAVRSMCFREESSFLVFLQRYFSLTIVHKLLIEGNTSQMLNVAGKTVMLNAYNGKTDIAFGFCSEREIDYDRRNTEEQMCMIRENFKDVGWRVPELLEEMSICEDFYFHQLCQIRMRSWTKGRVALVGDASYCPPPAAGMGGSVAILGAAALADALGKHAGDFRAAFQVYDESFRPTVETIQKHAVEFGLELFLPKSDNAIQERNMRLSIR